MFMKRKVTLILAMMLLVLTASAKKGPKYVFYFIGDGMGTNQVMGIQYYLQDIEGKYGYKPLCFTATKSSSATNVSAETRRASGTTITFVPL